MLFVWKIFFSHRNSLSYHLKMHVIFVANHSAGKVCWISTLEGTKAWRHLNATNFFHSPNKPFQCKECDKTFKRSAGLTYHTKTHTGEKPFSCRACSNAFSQAHELKTHQGIHTSLKLPCKYCEKIFNATTLLRNHIQSLHGKVKLTHSMWL